jgi:hypothetical protein
MTDDIQRELAKRTPPKQSLEIRMDLDRRVAMAIVTTERELLALKAPEPVVVFIPFHILKEAVAQILTAEVEIQLAKLPGGRNTPKERWPKGMAAVLNVADKLMEVAQLEGAGRSALDEASPVFKPNLNVILGGGK